MHRPRLMLVLAMVAAALLIPAAAASAAPFRATLDAPDHSPKAGAKNWKITVTARSNGGRALRATATYEFLFNGQKVSTQYPNPGSSAAGKRPYRFTGRFSDTILWPRRSAGFPLTFRVVVAVAGKGRVNLDWRVRVRR